MFPLGNWISFWGASLCKCAYNHKHLLILVVRSENAGNHDPERLHAILCFTPLEMYGRACSIQRENIGRQDSLWSLSPDFSHVGLMWIFVTCVAVGTQWSPGLLGRSHAELLSVAGCLPPGLGAPGAHLRCLLDWNSRLCHSILVCFGANSLTSLSLFPYLQKMKTIVIPS